MASRAQRYGGRGTTPTNVQFSSPTQAAIENVAQPVYEERTYTYDELRTAGREIEFQRRAIKNLQEKIQARRAKGTSPELIAGFENDLRVSQERLAQQRALLGSEAYGVARSVAPKNYQSGTQGKTRAENLTLRTQQSQRFQGQRTSATQLASERPGIYNAGGGTFVVSQLQPGSFRNQKGQVVSVREPIGQDKTGRYLYAPNAATTTRTVTGLNLFDPQTQRAVRERSGSYGSVGALFASADSPSFTPAGATDLAGSARKVRFKETVAAPFTRGAGRFLTTASRQGEQIAGAGLSLSNASGLSRVPFVGSKLTQKLRAGQYGLGGLGDLGSATAQNPDATLGGLYAGAFGGRVAGERAGAGLRVVAQRYGPKAARSAQTGLGVVGTGALAFDAATSTRSDFFQKLPSYVAGGAGFAGGYRSALPAPSVRVLAPSKISFSQAKAGRGSGLFSVRGTGRAQVVTQEFGLTKVQRPTVSYRVLSTQPGALAAARGDVPVRVGVRSSRFTLFDRPTRARQDYRGIYRPGSGSENGLLAITSGRGANRSTYEAIFSPVRTSVSDASGQMRIASGFSSRTFQGSRAPSASEFFEGVTVQEVVPNARVAVRTPYGALVRGKNQLFLQGKPQVQRLPFEYFPGEGVSKTVARSKGQVSFVDPVGGTRGFDLLQTYRLYREPRSVRVRQGVRRATSAVDASLFPKNARRTYSGLFLERPTVARAPPAEVSTLPRTRFGKPNLFNPPLAGLGFNVRPASTFSPVVALGFGRKAATASVTSSRTRLPLATGSLTDTGLSRAQLRSTSYLRGFDTSLRSRTGLTTSQRSTTPLVPPPALTFGIGLGTPGPRGGGFALPGFGSLGSGGLAQGGGTSRGYAYTPTLTSLVFGITTTRKQSARTQFTGLEVRPVVVASKRRKRKR